MRYNNNIRILKVDCIKNKIICNFYNVRAYPTLMVLHQGMLVEHYQGKREIENLKFFVNEIIKKYIPFPEESATPFSHQPVIEAPDVTNDEVMYLRRDTFDLAVNSGKTFIYFFAPWCKYCKQFAPIWEQLGKRVIEKGLMSKIAKVDCTKESNLCKQLKISAYPSVILFKTKYSSKPFKDNRDLESLWKFLKQNEHDEL